MSSEITIPSTEQTKAGAEDKTTEAPAPKAEPTKERSKSLRSTLRENFKAPSDGGKAVKEKAEAVAASPSPVVSAPVAPAEPILAPPDMSSEEREAFSKLTPDMQKYLSRRAYETRADYTRKTMALSEREKEIADVMAAVAPYREDYAKLGIPLPDAIRRMGAWDKAIRTNKGAASKEFLESYGVTFEDLQAEAQGQLHQSGQAQYMTQEQVEERASQIAEERVNKAFEQKQQEAIAYQTFNALNSFLQSKPLFGDPGTGAQLEAKMAPIVSGLRQMNPQRPAQELLEEAYNYVTRGDPTFSSLVSKLDAKSEAERKNAEAEKALAARRSLNGGPGTGTPKKQHANLRENLRANFFK